MSPAQQAIWPAVRIEKRGGVPVLTRDGEPWFGWAAERPYVPGHYEIFERLAGSGVTEQCHADATCGEDIYHPELRFWTGPGTFDGAAQDENFRRCLEAAPDALLQLRIYVGAPPWWLDQHPGELQVYADGSTRRPVQRSSEERFPSLASGVWREEAGHALERYIDWLVESGWSRRVSMLKLGYGITWEWALLGSDGFLDYSDAAQRHFVRWLKAAYGDEANLSAAWGRPVRFEEVRIPSAERRSRPGGTHGTRRLPSEQDVVDHQLSLSDLNVDFLLDLARRARARVPVPIGCFYGYTLTARDQRPFSGKYGAGGFQGGHHALDRVLESGDIDFLASPFNYCDRSLERGVLLEHVPLASAQAHGKAFFDEVDLWSHGNPPASETTTEMSVGIARNLEDSVAFHRRSFSQAIVRGKHQWFTELTGWWGPFRENFADPGLRAELRTMAQQAPGLIRRDRSPAAEVAFVLDEKSVSLLTLDNEDFRERVYRASVTWTRLGTPVDLVLLSDLVSGRCHPYRLVVPALVRQPAAIRALRAWAERNETGTAVLWDGQPDWYPPDRAALVQALDDAGVHRYVEEPVTVWANASMVTIHWPGGGSAGDRQVTVRFPRPVTGVEVFSGAQFRADADATLSWKVSDGDVALFVYAA